MKYLDPSGKKMEQLITELVHQRDVTRLLITNKINSNKSFDWLSQMRYCTGDKYGNYTASSGVLVD